MDPSQPNNPLHGVTLQAILEDLVARHGFEALGRRINVRCFTHDPSVASSLKFLRRTVWARVEVEKLYLEGQRSDARKRQRNRERAARRAQAAGQTPAADADPGPNPDKP